MFTISKDFQFSASHRLNGLPDDHPCSRLHGHNYTVRVSITGTLDATGFVIDYRELAPFKEFVDDTLDHRHLNDVITGNPTAEHLAAKLHTEVLAILPLADNITDVKVAVSETPKTWAEYPTGANA